MDIVLIILGFLLACICIWIVRKVYPKQDHIVWRLGLIIAAIIYVIFALVGHIQNIGIEMAGVIIYALFALLSKKYSLLWLSAGWFLHTLWDTLFHPLSPTIEYAPSWYPSVCLGFDVAIAVYILYVWKKSKSSKL